MKFNSEYYYDEGRDLFNKGFVRPESGNSWQVKAMQKGWDEAQARFGADMREDHVIPLIPSSPVETVVHHIAVLQSSLKTNWSEKRHDRIVLKIKKLKSKWGIL